MNAKQFNLLNAVNNEKLSLIMIPTMQCNLRCTYCYEKHCNDAFSEKDLAAITKFISAKSSSINTLNIEWFGGEPLLKKRMLLEQSKFIKDLCENNNIKLNGSMTTNATLLDVNFFEKLVELGINSYQITLDGDIESHDQLRIGLNGQKSFDDIWSNLLSYKSSELKFKVYIRIHLNAKNKNSVERLIDRYKEHFTEDARFSYFIKSIGDWSNITDSRTKELLSAENFNKSEQILKEFEQDRKEEDSYICYAAKPNSWVIAPGAKLLKCTVHLEHPANQVGYIDENGKLRLNQKHLNLWNAGISALNWEAMACPARLLSQFE